MLDVHEWEAELSEWLEPFLDALGWFGARMPWLPRRIMSDRRRAPS